MEQDPDVVDALLQWLYTLRYPPARAPGRPRQPAMAAQLYKIGRCDGLAELAEAAKDAFRADLDGLVPGRAADVHNLVAAVHVVYHQSFTADCVLRDILRDYARSSWHVWRERPEIVAATRQVAGFGMDMCDPQMGQSGVFAWSLLLGRIGWWTVGNGGWKAGAARRSSAQLMVFVRSMLRLKSDGGVSSF
jgi:hypothetical protein